MTEALFLETAECEEQLKEQGERRLNVSDVLKILGVSRSGYINWKKRLPSQRELKKQAIKERILEIYHDSHQNYGAPKITECLKKESETIAEKTVGNYMRELGIKAQYVSNDYISITADMQRSYSKKAYPWDNACIEAFHALIKREWLNRFKIFDYNHAYKLVFQCIETFYNTVRIHSHCGYLSPNEYEDKYWKELKDLELIAG